MPDLDADPVAQAKQAARLAARATRARCHAEAGGGAGRAIAAHLLSLLPDLGRTAADLIIAGYHPRGDEVDVIPALTTLAAAGYATALPTVAGRAWPLAFRLWRPGHPLVPGAFGVMEPMAEAPLVQPGLVLVPLLAFDQAGYRLGYGGGFYDRTLVLLRAEAPVVAVGISYAGQGVDKLPTDEYDQKLDWIVTEQGVRRPA